MDRRRPSLTEVAITAASAAIGFAFVRSDSPQSTGVAGGLLVAMALVGMLTAADRPDRAGLVRATVACAVGVLLGSWLTALARAPLLVLVFVVGRGARTLQLERKAATEQAEAILAEERARIARDLHDVIAHSLGVVVVQVQAAERVMDSDPEKARNALNAAASVGRDALDDMHRMVGVMRGGGGRIESQPSLADVARLVDQAGLGGLTANLSIDSGVVKAALAPGLEVAVYRIVQEALANAARHATGGKVDVHIAQRPDGIEVQVTSSGGRARGDAGGGFGLAGMRERAAIYGGSVEAGPRPEGGFLVRAWLPAKGS